MLANVSIERAQLIERVCMQSVCVLSKRIWWRRVRERSVAMIRFRLKCSVLSANAPSVTSNTES